MAKINIPAVGETEFFENRENKNSTVVVLPNASSEAFSTYCEMLKEKGFENKEARSTDTHLYASYFDGESAIFLNYFSAMRELYIAIEENCRYFSYSDTPSDTAVAPQITQMGLEDYGMSYVVRLSDGRFIVFDGGRDFEPDRERLYSFLKESSPHEKPVIAAWIMSHPHSDHFHLFVGFADSYAEDVVIEKFIFNFPEHDDLTHYPKLAASNARFDYDNSSLVWIPKMLERIEKTGAAVYTAHTGQIYKIGDAVCEILASIDDTIHTSDNINAISLVIRMELAGQTILWATDAPFSVTKLSEKYGEYLRADILQVPHHGFQSGTAEGEIRGYELIKPRVCLMPVSDYNAYTAFCTHRGGTRFLMTCAGIEELITDGTRTLTLPYTPPSYARAELERKYRAGLESCGANTWIFTELDSANAEDFEFTLLNMTHIKPTVWIELYFEDKSKCVRHIKTELSALSMKRMSIIGEDVDADALYFNWLSLKKQGIPENAPFSARFTCDTPIVVSHKTHKASYHS
ncbi:MAG: hypothetical protein IJ011_05815 [Clostridia bacterium]|nr:hypothetical protein [Clostridia bacterium]